MDNAHKNQKHREIFSVMEFESMSRVNISKNRTATIDEIISLGKIVKEVAAR